VEDRPALSLLRLALPGTDLRTARMTQASLAAERPLADPTAPANGWLLFGNPFHMNVEDLLARLERDAPGVPVVGGLASADLRAHATSVFLNEEFYSEGAVGVALSGAARLHSVVSQGCIPIGEPWTITDARAHSLKTIANRPAYEVLLETVQALPAELRERVKGNLKVGLATNEYRATFGRGDFLIRNITGVDEDRGAVIVGAHLKVGQTMQFQLRDPDAADQDLRELLALAARDLGPRPPLAALVCSCNGRGAGLFGEPDHDARSLDDRFPGLPASGCFCNGEIGPVGGRLFLHGFTASIGLLTL
jgi:small ligand-binding sensory domain FIST